MGDWGVINRLPYRRKPTLLIVFLCAALLFLFDAVNPVPGYASGQKKETLTIGYCNYMPFYFKGLNEKPRGILVDIWELWSQKTGINVEFSLLPWPDVLDQTSRGLIDINALMYRSEKRTREYLFSEPLMNLSTYLFLRKKDGVEAFGKTFSRLDQISGLTFGVVAQDFTRTYLASRLPHLNPVIYNDHETLVQAAVHGEIDGFLMEGPVASTYITKHNGDRFIVKLENPVYTKPLYAGVKNGNQDLIRKVNSGLSLIESREIQQIFQNWTGNAEPHLLQPFKGTLKIASSIDNMPFHFADEKGQAVGYFIDLWRLWSKKTGIDVQFETAPWAESLAMVRDGKADIHAGCFFSVQRDTFLDYAGVLSNCETHFFFHESIFGLKGLEDLKGFQIGILDQDYAVEYVSRELPDGAIKRYESHHALFEGVANGEVRVFVCDTPTALYFLKKKNLLSVYRYHPTQPLYRKPFYSAVKEGNTALVETINKGLKAISPNEKALIERKWMGTPDPVEKDGLVIAIAQGFSPFSMFNAQGQPSGLFIDYWRLWSQKTGKPVSFRLYDREAAVHALKDGIVDVVSFLPPKKAIKGWTQKSESFYRLHWYFYHPRSLVEHSADNPAIGSVIGAVAGSLGNEWLLENRSGMKIITYETTRQMLLAAAKGKLDTFIALPQEMAVLPDRLGLPDSFIQSQYPLFQQQVGAVVRNFNPEMIQWINDGFGAIEHFEKIALEMRWIKDPKARVFNHRSDQILLTKREQQWLTRYHDLNPPIRLGVHPEWPPFEFTGANQVYKGMVSDYVNLLNQRLGLNMTMAELISMPQEGSAPQYSGIDVIPSAVSFSSENNNMLRSDTYIEFPWVIINRQEAPLIGGIRDFYGKTLAVIDHYAIKKKIQNEHQQIQVYSVDSIQEGMAAVLSGRADGCLENLAVAGYQIQAQNQTGLKLAAATDLSGTGLVFSVRSDWPELVDILNKGIASITDQEHDQIRQKWFSVRFEHQMNAAARELFFKIGIGGLFVAGLFTFWNWQIRKRKQAAEAANLSKTKFLASLSHEIRTPLNAILGMTDMTLKTKVTSQQKKNLKTVKDSALHLLDVITDILDYSTLEAGKMRIQNQVFSLTELLEGIDQTWSFLAGEKGLSFDLKINDKVPLSVKSDPVRLQQILENLISNALKFTHTGGISVTVKPAYRMEEDVTDPDEAFLLFLIEDTGIGIKKDQQERIFERFTQAENSVTRKYGGTGLGLSICREAVRLMGGTLGLKSQPGEGSRFYLKLPLKRADQVTVKEDLSIPDNTLEDKNMQLTPEKQTFLMVEDDRVNAEVFKSYFHDTCHTIYHAEDGIKAIDILKESAVDMVFMDIEMPGMDGISCCRAIRSGAAGEKNTNIPVIAMSAHVLEEFEEKSRSAGMNYFIAKPVDEKEVFRVIEKFQRKVPPKPSLWDRDKNLEALGGNKGLLERIVRIFIQETRKHLEYLKKSAKTLDLTEVQRLAHTLKGSAARIYAERAYEKAKDLEERCKHNKNEISGLPVQETITEFETLICLLEKQVRDTETRKEDNRDPYSG